jgi:hypothetical protein
MPTALFGFCLAQNCFGYFVPNLLLFEKLVPSQSEWGGFQAFLHSPISVILEWRYAIELLVAACGYLNVN